MPTMPLLALTQMHTHLIHDETWRPAHHMRDQRTPRPHASPRVWALLLLCWLVGINLRTVILGVPPVLPLIQHDLKLDNTLIGLLTALPVLCMGVLAFPAAGLAARVGGRVAVALGLGLL